MCIWHEIKTGRSYPTALSNISLSILISYKCVEVIFPRMESVAVISLVYKVQMSKLIQLLRQCFNTLYVHDGDLWHSIIHGCLSKPKCRLSLTVVSQPLVGAPHIPAGVLAGRSTAWTWWGLGVARRAHGQPALAPQGRSGIPTSPPPPALAQPLGEVGGSDSLPALPPCHAAASSARGEVSPGV